MKPSAVFVVVAVLSATAVIALLVFNPATFRSAFWTRSDNVSQNFYRMSFFGCWNIYLFIEIETCTCKLIFAVSNLWCLSVPSFLSVTRTLVSYTDPLLLVKMTNVFSFAWYVWSAENMDDVGLSTVFWKLTFGVIWSSRAQYTLRTAGRVWSEICRVGLVPIKNGPVGNTAWFLKRTPHHLWLPSKCTALVKAYHKYVAII